MAENILKKIVELKKKKIDKLKKKLNHSDILESIKKNKKYIDTMIKKGNALDVKEVVSCFDFAFSRGRGANIRDLVILPTNQSL